MIRSEQLVEWEDSHSTSSGIDTKLSLLGSRKICIFSFRKIVTVRHTLPFIFIFDIDAVNLLI